MIANNLALESLSLQAIPHGHLGKPMLKVAVYSFRYLLPETLLIVPTLNFKLKYLELIFAFSFSNGQPSSGIGGIQKDTAKIYSKFSSSKFIVRHLKRPVIVQDIKN